jgi:hypothetical protein
MVGFAEIVIGRRFLCAIFVGTTAPVGPKEDQQFSLVAPVVAVDL